MSQGGYIRTPEDTGEGYRLSGGETVVTRHVYMVYGEDFLRHLFPHSTIHIAEDLLFSMEEEKADEAVDPDTPGGPT